MLSMSLESFQSSYSFGVAIPISFVGSFGALRTFWSQLKSFGVVRLFFMSSGVFCTVLEFFRVFAYLCSILYPYTDPLRILYH